MLIETGMAVVALMAAAAAAEPVREPPRHFANAHVFQLEWADDPRISPDGKRIAYVRASGDIMTDRFRRAIWLVNDDGSNHRPLVQGTGGYASPRWSPDGKALAYTASEDDSNEVRVFYLDTARSATLARLPSGAGNLAWSPNGKWLAFEMFVKEDAPEAKGLPAKPEGAKWAESPHVIDRPLYRADGEGYLPPGFAQIFVLPADGGTPRQVTWQARDHDGRLSWTPDAKHLLYSANGEEDYFTDPLESAVYSADVSSGDVARLTTRNGPEDEPVLSPDGKRLAYTGFDDHEQGYQVTELYVAGADGSDPKSLTSELDRDVHSPQWGGDGALYFLFEDRGTTKLGRVSASGGKVTTLASELGGTDVGRPYTSGAYSINEAGRWVANTTSPRRPADLLVTGNHTITSLNDDVFAGITLGPVEHIEAKSSADGRLIDAWIVRPPDFDNGRRYPLLLEIHGGPFAAHGPRFSAEMRLYAAARYVVVDAHPRGSTSYGGECGNLIHHSYPSQDYDDLMSVVDAVIAHEPVDKERLFVTGGSGGGILPAWIVGSTPRFHAAIVQKPVINWTSFALTSDAYNMFSRYWFGAYPWEEGAQESFWKRSPLSRVGNVSTPTAVMVGEEDYRTPAGEAEQFYQALRLRGIPT